MYRTIMLSLGAALLIASPASRAVTIDFVPAAQSVSPGGTAQVDIVVGGLGDGVAPSLGSFDIDVGFDAGVLSLASVALGGDLGDPASILETDAGSGLLGAGLLDVFVISFLFDFELDALQSDRVVLATMVFDAIGVGVSPLSLPQVILGDALGAPLALAGAAGSGSIAVRQASVPEPGALALLGAAFGMLLVRVPRGRRGAAPSLSRPASPAA